MEGFVQCRWHNGARSSLGFVQMELRGGAQIRCSVSLQDPEACISHLRGHRAYIRQQQRLMRSSRTRLHPDLLHVLSCVTL